MISLKFTSENALSRRQSRKNSRTTKHERVYLPSIVFILAFAIFMTGFFASGVYLRFSNSRFEKEISRLQSQKSTLNSDINGLRASNKSLQDPGFVYAYAVNELGLTPYGAERASLDVSERHYAFYKVEPPSENSSNIRRTAMEDAMEIFQKFQSHSTDVSEATTEK